MAQRTAASAYSIQRGVFGPNPPPELSVMRDGPRSNQEVQVGDILITADEGAVLLLSAGNRVSTRPLPFGFSDCDLAPLPVTW